MESMLQARDLLQLVSSCGLCIQSVIRAHVLEQKKVTAMLPSLEKSDDGQSPDYKILNLKPRDQKTASPKQPDRDPKHQVRSL